MINVLQKVTTFPLEMIQFPEIMSDSSLRDYSNNAIHNYYTNPIPNTNNGPLTDVEIKSLNTTVNPNVTKATIDQYKKRFIVYNAIYNKLFANSLNLLDNTAALKLKIASKQTADVVPVPSAVITEHVVPAAAVAILTSN